jgi:pyruvate,orthophosphate dikinase
VDERSRGTYRRLQHLEDLQGTAVTVQAMVFGNAGGSSGAGVAFRAIRPAELQRR